MIRFYGREEELKKLDAVLSKNESTLDSLKYLLFSLDDIYNIAC